MQESIFVRDGEHFLPTAHARGPWSPDGLHGGAPAALLTCAFEQMEPGADLRMARIGIEYLRPATFAPMELSTRIVRPGRRVQELAGELRAGGEVICRASAMRVQAVPADLPRPEGATPGGQGDRGPAASSGWREEPLPRRAPGGVRASP